MARQEIILGTPPTGLGGDTPRVANSKINAMTSELYQGIGTPTSPLPVSKGGTGGTSQATAQTGLGLVKVTSSIDSAGGNLLLAGWGGLGGQLQNRSYTPDQIFTTQAGGSFSYANNGGAYPAGVTDGALINMGYDTAGQFAYQLLGDWRTGYMYRRGRAGGVSGAWGMVYDSINATLDAQSSGGINSRTVVSGIVVNKFISGLLVMNGVFGNTPSCPANTVTTVTITLPASSGADPSFTTPVINLIPSTVADFTPMYAYMASPAQLAIVLKNGATAQTFSARGIIMGHWK